MLIPQKKITKRTLSITPLLPYPLPYIVVNASWMRTALKCWSDYYLCLGFSSNSSLLSALLRFYLEVSQFCFTPGPGLFFFSSPWSAWLVGRSIITTTNGHGRTMTSVCWQVRLWWLERWTGHSYSRCGVSWHSSTCLFLFTVIPVFMVHLGHTVHIYFSFFNEVSNF